MNLPFNEERISYARNYLYQTLSELSSFMKKQNIDSFDIAYDVLFNTVINDLTRVMAEGPSIDKNQKQRFIIHKN